MINLLGLFPHIKRNKPFLNEVVHIFNTTTFNMVLFNSTSGKHINDVKMLCCRIEITEVEPTATVLQNSINLDVFESEVELEVIKC